MFSYFEPNFVKNSFGKVVFQILTRENRLFGRHFETVQHINIFFVCLQNCDFLIAHTYMVQISLQNSCGKVISGGSMEPLGDTHL